MKKLEYLVLLVTIFFIVTGCAPNNNSKELPNSIDKDVIEKLSVTKKIVIKDNLTEKADKTMGTITEEKVIAEIITILSSGKNNDDMYNCDGQNINFEMYDSDGNLIDIIYIWTGDSNGGRIMPKSIHSGCSYYYIDSGIIPIIEKNTNTKFFIIIDLSESCNETLELIYEDSNYKYYFSCIKSEKMFIEFMSTNQRITIKKALENNQITIDQLLEKLPDLFIKQNKKSHY